jgi:beta-galactosidase
LTVAVENGTESPREVTVRMRLVGPDGRVAEESAAAEIGARGAAKVTQTISLRTPSLWSPATPRLYRAEVELVVAGKVVDRAGTPFGVRKIEVDAVRGLRINGETVKLKGACLHHDNGVLGAAAIDRAEHRRVELMKANGFNAIRCSHNPPSAAFLDACDRLGMLVIDEAFDMWQVAKNPEDYHRHFDQWWQRDLESMILRDRHHPSVVFWSIGNEIKERADPQGVAVGNRLRDHVRRLDPTRPVTAGICAFWEFREKREWEESDPAFGYLDVGGYNYEWRHYEQDHKRYPARVMVGTESFPAEAFESWRMVQRHPYVLGDFVWTGMDYVGESGIGHSYLEGDAKESLKSYPWFNGYCGDIDLIGGKKPQSYYRDVLWGISRLEMAVQRPVPAGRTEKLSKWGWSDELRSWTWPGAEGRLLKVRVYSSASEVRLLVNGREVGTKPVSEETRLTAEFEVPYLPGELRAIAVENGKEVGALSFKTTGRPASIRLRADRTTVFATRNDLSYVTAEVLDEAGAVVPDAIVAVTFTVEGVGELAGSGNSNPQDMGSFRRPRCLTFHGRCLAVIRPVGRKGEVMVRAAAEGLRPGAATILVR